MQKHKFKVIKENENPLQSVIEKDNLTVEFTLQDIIDDTALYDKSLKELEAQLSLEESSAQNIENNHPECVNPTEEDIKKAHHIVLYMGYKKRAADCIKSIEHIKKAKADSAEELAEIEKQTGLTLGVAIDPEDLK